MKRSIIDEIADRIEILAFNCQITERDAGYIMRRVLKLHE